MIKLLPDHYYHIYNHANSNEKLFREDSNYEFFLKKYHKHLSGFVDTLSYSLLPNHFHFLIKVLDEDTLLRNTFPKFKTLEKLLEKSYVSKRFSNFFSSYTQSYNRVYNREGSLFRKNFRKKIVMQDDYFSKLIHYIHANPVHHGFVNNMGSWKWSSYNCFLSNAPTKINRNEILDWFGGKEQFVKFHQQPIFLKSTDMFK